MLVNQYHFYPDTIVVAGTYRGKQNVVHYYNPKTMVNVIKDGKGDFISVWKLNRKQLENLKSVGKIGGG